jgi:hypothetical protein
MDAFYASPWPGILVCTILFISDHAFTLACARMCQAAGVRQHFVFEGSYELTPFHQPDIDALRRVSPRFWFALLLPWLLLQLVWRIGNSASLSLPIYEFALGAIILMQLTIHVRHLRNYFLFRTMIAGEGVAGRMEYARRTILTQSAVEFFAFAALYAAVFILTMRWFVLGGAFACSVIGVEHRHLAGRAKGR